MINIGYFITCLAWVFAVFYSFKTILCILGAISYSHNKLQQAIDGCKGVKRTFPLKHYPMCALVSIVWLITYYN